MKILDDTILATQRLYEPIRKNYDHVKTQILRETRFLYREIMKN